MISQAVRRPLLADAVLSRVMDVLTGGPFLAGLALLVGANNLEFGLLAALPFLAQVVQLPAVAVLLRWRDRRRVVAWCAGTSRALLVLIAVILLVAPGALDAPALIAILAVSAMLTVTATAAWNWWMRDLLPADELGGFFGRRLRGATMASLIAMLLAGLALDSSAAAGRQVAGYALVFGIGGVAGLGAVVALKRTPHADPGPAPPVRESLDCIRRGLREAPRDLLATLSLTAVAAAFALPFTAVFLMRGLGYSPGAAATMAVIGQIAYLFGVRPWGHLSDRHGDRAVLAITLGFLAAALLGWGVTGWSSRPLLFVWVAGLHLLAGFAMGGIELASTNLLLRSAPTHNVAGHLATVSVVRAAAAGAGVLAAAALWQAMGSGVVWSATLGVIGLWELRGFQVLCLLAIAPALFAVVLARRMPSPGPRIADVTRAMRREVHQMSSVPGIRALVHAVSYSVELLARPALVMVRLPGRGGRRKGQAKGR